MPRTPALLPGGLRLSDYLSVGVIARVFPRDAILGALRATGRESLRRRELPAEVMVYYVIAMSLFRQASTREVLRCLMEGLRWMSPDIPARVSGKSSISRARGRLGPEPFVALREACVRPLAASSGPGARRRGLRLVAVDGSTLAVPDEAENRSCFGLPGASRGSAAFPQIRLSALTELGTRAPLDWCAGPLSESEAVQAERLAARLGPGMLLLADRGYCGFPLWKKAASGGADLLWRARSNMRLPVLESLPDGSWMSVIRGNGKDRNRSLGSCPVRVIRYVLPGSGKDETYTLITTLRDPALDPAAELAALYHQRWEIESAYDEVKTHMLGPGAMLRSKTPELVRQEFEGLMLAHYAVRSLIHEAAEKAGEDPGRLSFTHAHNTVRRRIQNPGGFSPGGAGI